jgi:hypothetical protein
VSEQLRATLVLQGMRSPDQPRSRQMPFAFAQSVLIRANLWRKRVSSVVQGFGFWFGQLLIAICELPTMALTFCQLWRQLSSPPASLTTQGPFFPVDVVGPAPVRHAAGNLFDVYNYSSFHDALASTRTVTVTTFIPNNNVGVTCPK